MNKQQKSYAAFMESVCNKFSCPEALPVLQEGFRAFCESILTESSSNIWDDDNDLADQLRVRFATEWPLINDNHHIEIDQETNPDGKVIVVIYFDGNKVCSASGNNIDGWEMALARTHKWQKYDSFDLLMSDIVDEFSLY